uniref:Uncharacterized protein n=1 Tax=Helianthus annuus TaxID=4232 RepID=A0A251UYJ8_HELAN
MLSLIFSGYNRKSSEPSKSYLYLLGGIQLGLNLYLAQVLGVIGWFLLASNRSLASLDA